MSGSLMRSSASALGICNQFACNHVDEVAEGFIAHGLRSQHEQLPYARRAWGPARPCRHGSVCR